MVQIINLPQSTEARLTEELGRHLGTGLSKASQEIQQQRSQQQQGGILSKVLSGTASPEEKAQLSPEYQLEAEKLLKPKAPLGGISGQQVPPEVSKAIPQILNDNKDATADELAAVFDKFGIPRAYSDTYVENRRQQDVQKAKTDIKTTEISRREKIEFHKEGAKYDEGLTKKAESAERKIKAIEKQQELQPDISNWDRFIAATSAGTRFEDLLKSQSAHEFDSYALPMIEGKKENFGVRLSDADLRLIVQKIATSSKNPEANKAIMEYQKLESKLDIEKRKIGDKIKKENGGLRPLDFDAKIRQKMNEEFGDEIQSRANDIMALEDNPQAAARIIGRKKVPPGTPLDNSSIAMYMKITDNDPKKAEKLALEDGYVY